MKMGNEAVAMSLAITLLSGILLQGAEAQVVDCLSQVSGAGAPFGDASALVAQLRVMPGKCCATSSGGFCSVLLTSGSAAATICGPNCPNCADVGNGLNSVLAQCNQLNEVQGAFGPDSSGTQIFYLTSVSNHP